MNTHQRHGAPTVPARADFFPVSLETMIRNSDASLRNAVSRSNLSSQNKQQLLELINHIRVYKHLFMHTYVHLVSCCHSRNLDQLLGCATFARECNSVQQLARHSLFKELLRRLWTNCTCNQHIFLVPRFVIPDDDADLLYLLLYCSKKPDLYELPSKPPISMCGDYLKESEQIVELLWQFLLEHKNDDVARRLRACIYRMARKSAYLPEALRIGSSISDIHRFGVGGNSILMKAKMGGKNVVIKRILCDDRTAQKKCLELFAGEAILWKTLKHKNIVPFIGIIAEGVDMGLVSPFFKNGNIKNYMKNLDHKHRLALAYRWSRDLAEGLEYIHSQEPPIIHGDLKGDNVLVDDGGHACIGDFGQSHASDSGKYLDSTRVGLPACPFHWMAPEIMTGDENVKASTMSDMYSFGCVLYEMVSGKIPFEGYSPNNVMRCVVSKKRPNKPEWISGNDPLWQVVETCWVDRPGSRPSAAHLVRHLVNTVRRS